MKKTSIHFFLILCTFSLFYILPVILFHTCFNDDLGITLHGITGLNGDGRPLGQFLSSFLSGGGIIADEGPLPLLCSVLFLSYGLVLYAKENLDFLEKDILFVFVLLTILTNPFIMSTLFYRTGSFVMVTALSIPFFLFAFNKELPLWLVWGIAFLAGVTIMSLYQPAFGMSLILIGINMGIWLFEGKNNIRKDIVRLVGLGMGAVVYMVIIMPKFIDSEGWRHNAAQTVSGVNADSVKIFLLNIWNSAFYIRDYLQNLSEVSRVFLGAYVLVAWMYSLYLGYIKTKKNKWRCIFVILTLLVAPGIITILSYLPLAILNSLEIKCRIFIALGGTLLYLGIFLLYFAKRNRIVVAVILSGYLLGQYSCMYAYGNSVKNEAEYERYLAYSIAHDLETINAGNDYQTFSFSGIVPRSRKYELMREKYPFYEEIVPRYLSNGSWIGAAWLLPYLQKNIWNEDLDETDQIIVEKEEPVMQNSVYSCYVNGSKIIIAFY